MAVRNIKKNLAGMEDLLQGVGTEDQVRADSTYTLGKVDVPYAVDTVAKMKALDVTLFTRARVYSDTLSFVDYIYDPARLDGVTPNIGAGTWIVIGATGVLTTAERNALSAVQNGTRVFDSDLDQPVWFNTSWKDATGTPV